MNELELLDGGGEGEGGAYAAIEGFEYGGLHGESYDECEDVGGGPHEAYEAERGSGAGYEPGCGCGEAAHASRERDAGTS